MAKSDPVDEVSFWPGYVDAIINIVLNILFMVALLTIALSTMDFTPAQERHAGESHLAMQGVVRQQSHVVGEALPHSQAREAADPTPVPIAVPRQSYRSATRGGNSDNPSGGAEQVVVSARQDSGGVPLLIVDFARDAVDIPAGPARASLRDAGERAGNDEWLIWTRSDTREATQTRLAFIRLMAVRSALIESGVSPSRIQTRILDVRDEATPASERVFVARQAS